MSDDINRAIGRHDGQIDALQKDMQELRADVKQILTTLSEARGGWRTLLLVGGMAGALGAFTTKVAMFFGWIPK